MSDTNAEVRRYIAPENNCIHGVDLNLAVCDRCNGTAIYTEQQLIAHTNKAIEEAIYGFHEYVMGKNIIQPETDQAFNYARLHRAVDAYIAERRKLKEDL